MNIIQKTSTVHTAAYARRPILYLVIHYTAGTNSKAGTARSIAAMFGNPNNRPASADFIVDDGEIVQYNGDILNRYCYAVGGNRYGILYTKEAARFYGKCRNYNSISIEICSTKTNRKSLDASDTDWSLSASAVDRAVELARYLMQKYSIPADRVIMHHQVTGKLCPQPWCLNDARLAGWNRFKARLTAGTGAVKEDYEMALTESQVKLIVKEEMAKQREAIIAEVLNAIPTDKVYDTIDEIPEWAQDAVQRRMELGILNGTGMGLGLSFDLLRQFVLADREAQLKARAEEMGME